MDKIIEYLNNQTNNKYKDLLFFGANYNKNLGTMQIQFFCEQNYDKYKENVEEIKVLCKNFFQNMVPNIEVTLKTKTLTMQSLKESIISATKKQDLFGVDLSSIKINFDEDETEVVIPYQIGGLTDNQIFEAKQAIQDEIEKNFNYTINVKFVEQKTENSSVLNTRKERIIEDNSIEEYLKQSEVVTLKNVKSIYGDFDKKTAYIAGHYGDDDEIAVVGIVKSCYIKETKPKDSENENARTKKYMSFELEYEDLSTKIVWFFPKKIEVEELEIGSTIAVFGKKEIFNNNINIRLKSLASCTFVPPEKVWRKCPTEYRHVKPEMYVHAEQTNFLDTYKKTENQYLLNNTFVVYDLETTGTSTQTDKIIDIGAYKIVEGVIVEKFCTFVNPETKIPEGATKVNHITNSMVENSPTIDMALPDFYKFCHGAILVGYNNIGFDDLFIKREGNRLLLNFDNKVDDVYKIAFENLHGLHNYKLGTVCNHENVLLIDAHRAASDALATAKLFVKLVEKYC